jgi:hypothetical protein
MFGVSRNSWLRFLLSFVRVFVTARRPIASWPFARLPVILDRKVSNDLGCQKGPTVTCRQLALLCLLVVARREDKPTPKKD